MRCLLLFLSLALVHADDRTARVDQLFAPWDKPETPGCAVAVVEHGTVLHQRGYGAAHLEHGVPITTRSVFYLASVSKQFTATAIALLAERGKLSLDDPIRKHFPELPAYTQPITVRHLIHHTSGLRDYLSLFNMAGRPDNYYTSDSEVLELLARQKALNFAPNTEHLYSNSGYVLLAQLVRRVSGQSLRDWAAANIFAPLEMRDSQFLDDHNAVVRNRAVGYSPRPGGGFAVNSATLDVVGDGGMFSTVEDLVRWEQKGRDQLAPVVLTPGALHDGKKLNYAWGLVWGEYRGLRTLAHGGSLRGYRTMALGFPDLRFSVFCLCNNAAANAGRLAQQVAEIYLGDRMTPESKLPGPQSPATPPAVAKVESPASYAGDYYSEELDASYRLVVEGGELRVRRRYGAIAALEPAGQDRFRVRGLMFAFTRDAAGAVTGFSLSEGRVRDVMFVRR
jgi:CubicO group peptidase (beta-lactamase class C family)